MLDALAYSVEDLNFQFSVYPRTNFGEKVNAGQVFSIVDGIGSWYV